MLWRVREGMQGLLAAVRPPGITMLIEDVCVPPARVAEAAKDLQALLSRHGFLPGLAGHASAGNLHFILTAEFGKEGEHERYDAFISDLVELIVDKYDGSLKAEHGTGINMAPFVEREWGPEATELMWEIKRLADPAGILAPGVVLNRDPGVHLRNLKGVPEVEESVTKCIECGFCEAVCPSQNVTTTPRQRIVLRREMARQPPGSPVHVALSEQYEYDGIETCAADGSCMTACPVAIDTGTLIKDLRHREHGARRERAGWSWPSATACRARRQGRVAGGEAGAARCAGRSMPPPAPAKLPRTAAGRSRAVYLPVVHQPHLRPARRCARRPDPPRGAGGGLGARRPAAVDPARRGRSLLRHAVELQGLPRRRRRDGGPDRGGAAPLDRRRRAAGGDGRQLVQPGPA